MSIQIEKVRTDSFAMDFFRFGRGKETLVILPGLSVQSVMGSAELVAEAYRLLADEFTVYVFDRRKELPGEYSVREMAEDTSKALRALGLAQVNVFGASQGGMMALEIAIGHPELVRKLVLGSAAARVPETLLQTAAEWIRLAKAGNAEALYLAFGEALYPREVFEQSRELLIRTAETVTGEELRRFVILAEGVKGFDVTGDLEKLVCPVLVLASADDRVLGPDAAGDIAEKLGGRPDFALFTYEGYGHAAYDLAPDYKERILRFLMQGAAD